jgi:hypothetical protein
MISSFSVIFMVGSLFATDASAHKPSYANNHNSKETAFEVEDPEISIALYAEMTCTSETLWLHLSTDDVSEVWVELGLPQLDRLEDYRPSLAVLAEGLPDDDNEGLPFDVPEGMGSMVIDTADVEMPIDFYEPFTQTDSWILYREWLSLPENTDVYIVAFNPEEYTGKLWVAVGLTEDFSDADVSDFTEWLDKTQAFHEVDDTDEHVELDCSLIGDDDSAVSPASAKTGKGGCSTTGHRETSLPLLILMLGMMVGVRSRRHAES